MALHHSTYIQKTLLLAARGKGRTSPNPAVGAVIVRANRIIAADYHRKAGTPHAEILALKKAGSRARGATLYVNLEPCCHTDKKTPPCTVSIVQAGVKRVVAAMLDPNPRVCGKGIRELEKAGIETIVGVMEQEARTLNEAFTKFIKSKKPFVILKIAQSLDGKIATASGESRWITGTDARNLVHRMRNEVDAVLVGIGTVQKDNPSLDCRIRGGRNPYRVVIDGRLAIPPDAKVLNHSDGKTVIAAIDPAAFDNPASRTFSEGGMNGSSERNREKLTGDPFQFQKKIDLLTSRGVKIIFIRSKGENVDLKELMHKLGELNITSVMIEGGSSINSSALASGIVDKMMIFLSPKIIGGSDAISSFGGRSPLSLDDATRIRDVHIRTVGDDVLIEGYI